MELKFPEIKSSLKKFDITINKTKVKGEYRVNVKNGTETQAYYTDDLMDAYQTGLAMYREHQNQSTSHLKTISEDSTLLEVARAAIEDALVDLRDAGIFTLRNNGLVIKGKDGSPSYIIRMGSEDAIRIGLQAICKHLEGK